MTPGHFSSYHLGVTSGVVGTPWKQAWYLRGSLETGSGGSCVRPLLSGTVGLVVTGVIKTLCTKSTPLAVLYH